jgi:hypothetical protein
MSVFRITVLPFFILLFFFKKEGDRLGKIQDGQVFPSDIADVTIVSSDIADSAITSSKLAGGAVKPNMHRVQGNQVTIAPNTITCAHADCPPGYFITGGGFVASNFDVGVARSAQGASETWIVTTLNPTGFERSVKAYALCIEPSPISRVVIRTLLTYRISFKFS